MPTPDIMEKLVALSKRRGFVYPGSEIYGGLANAYEYGPLGVELKRNIQNEWWKTFIQRRSDMLGLDSSIILHPKVWEASGHVAGFADSMIDCKHCQTRMRADHLIEDFFAAKDCTINVEGKTEEELDAIIRKNKIPCPVCKKFDWTPVRKFNLLFETHIGIVPEAQSKVYLRGETAQGIFVTFKNITNSMRTKLPFGVGQIGKSFRNEITKGNFIFRTLEFEQAEIEYFFDPDESDWKKLFSAWQQSMWDFVTHVLGVNAQNLRWREHSDEERSFYSKRTEDLEYRFPFGFKELWGLAYRTDYDLKQHMKYSGVDLSYVDAASGKKFVPHVIEPAVGINRLMAMVMIESYVEEEGRVVMKLPAQLAPYKAAVFPLLANKPELIALAKSIYDDLRKDHMIAWDDRGNIGKRYYAQDEIGTPWAITIDFDSLHDQAVTVRDRDTMQQERIPIAALRQFIADRL
ncbi:glycine--tRNA ligase [Patescibacteria group bacterium]|nr:glycine--tRNA ligase [Patescibacteria group bacterium]